MAECAAVCEEENKEVISVLTTSLEAERTEVSRLKKALDGTSLPSISEEKKKYEHLHRMCRGQSTKWQSRMPRSSRWRKRVEERDDVDDLAARLQEQFHLNDDYRAQISEYRKQVAVTPVPVSDPAIED